jgi:predicted dehydrogenase
MEPVKLGVIGCGLAATNVHWPNLRQLGDKFQIVAVSDLSAERAEEFARLVGGVPYETDHRALLSKQDIEAVDIVAPVPLHHPLVADALEAGKHVLVEKPLAADLGQGELMLKLGSLHPQAKMVGENFRYRRAVRRTREIMDSGTIGRPYAGFCDFLVLRTNALARGSQVSGCIHLGRRDPLGGSTALPLRRP